MDQDRLEGAARNAGGALEEEFGRATGDTKTQLQGKATELKGRVQNLYGEAKDTAADTLKAARERAGQADDLNAIAQAVRSSSLSGSDPSQRR